METEMHIYLYSINKWHLIRHQGSLSSLLSFAQYPKSKTHVLFLFHPISAQQSRLRCMLYNHPQSKWENSGKKKKNCSALKRNKTGKTMKLREIFCESEKHHTKLQSNFLKFAELRQDSNLTTCLFFLKHHQSRTYQNIFTL